MPAQEQVSFWDGLLSEDLFSLKQKEALVIRRFDLWQEAFAECGLDMAFYANRRREYDEVFPWDHLDYGVSKAYLKRENEKAHESVTTPHCRLRCGGCGADKLNGGKCDARCQIVD